MAQLAIDSASLALTQMGNIHTHPAGQHSHSSSWATSTFIQLGNIHTHQLGTIDQKSVDCWFAYMLSQVTAEIFIIVSTKEGQGGFQAETLPPLLNVSYKCVDIW